MYTLEQRKRLKYVYNDDKGTKYYIQIFCFNQNTRLSVNKMKITSRNVLNSVALIRNLTIDSIERHIQRQEIARWDS